MLRAGWPKLLLLHTIYKFYFYIYVIFISSVLFRKCTYIKPVLTSVVPLHIVGVWSFTFPFRIGHLSLDLGLNGCCVVNVQVT